MDFLFSIFEIVGIFVIFTMKIRGQNGI